MHKGAYEPDRIRVEELNDFSTLVDDICYICGCKFSEHQPVQGYPWLRKLCDGELVRLK